MKLPVSMSYAEFSALVQVIKLCKKQFKGLDKKRKGSSKGSVRGTHIASSGIITQRGRLVAGGEESQRVKREGILLSRDRQTSLAKILSKDEDKSEEEILPVFQFKTLAPPKIFKAVDMVQMNKQIEEANNQ